VDEGPLRLEQAQRLALGTVMQTIVAHLAEAAGEHVLEKTADELQRFQTGGTGFPGFAVAIAEDDDLVIVALDGRVGKGDAVDVASQVGERVVAGADGLGVYDPGRLPDRPRDGGKDRGVVFTQGVAKTGAENPGEGAHGDEELRVGLVPSPVRAKAAAGGEDVNVGVVLQLARPGVQDGGEAGNCAEETGIAAEVQQRGG